MERLHRKLPIQHVVAKHPELGTDGSWRYRRFYAAQLGMERVFIKVGGRVLVDLDEYDSFLDAHRVGRQDTPEPEIVGREYRRRANQHRPSDDEDFAREGRKLLAMGLTADDVAQALRMHREQVAVMAVSESQ